LNFYLRQIPKSSLHSRGSTELRQGRYISSIFPLDGFGTKRWVVGCYVDLDLGVPESERKELVEKILAELNRPPVRKKFERKRTSPLYGNLEVFSAKFKKDSNGSFYIEMLLVTDERSNDHFWGQGVKMMQARPRRRKSS